MSETDDRHQQQIETEGKSLREGVSLVELWLKKIEAARAEEREWRTSAEKAIKIFEADEKTPYNVLASNGQVLLPALYNSTPTPDVRRKFDSGGPVEKMVVDIAERLISCEVDAQDYDTEQRSVVRDSYVTGRGVLRIRYAPQVGDGDVIQAQSVKIERVEWDRFVRGPSGSWATMPWVSFIHDLTRDELIKLNPRIGASIGVGDKGGESDDNEVGRIESILQTTRVYEVWDKASRSVLFLSEKHKAEPIVVVRDPLGLRDFFPVFRPLQPVQRVSSLTPVVPYDLYREQSEELNRITRRINKLTDQLKVRGLTDARIMADLERLRQCDDGEYVGANDATALAQGSKGLEGSVLHWPMEPTVAALQQLYVQRESAKQIIDQISGVADILRGEVDPNEKLGQTQIKQQAGSIRITDWQNEIARINRDVFRAMVEIFARWYEDQTIQVKTGLPTREQSEQAAQEQQVFPIALQAFRSEIASYLIDIETDSTIRADMTRNQEQMTQFMGVTGQFVQGMTAAGQAMPPLIPAMIEVYTAFARKFKLGKQAEDVLDGLPIKVDQAMAQMQARMQGPSPEQQAMEQEQGRAQQQFEAEQQREAAKVERENAKAARDEQREALRHQREMEKMDRAHAIETEKIMRDREFAEQDRQAKRETAEFEMGNRERMAQIDQTSALRSKGLDMDQETGAAIDPIAVSIGQMGEAIMQMSELIAAGNAAVLDAVAAPKTVQLARGKDGRVSGAVVAPAQQRVN